MKAAHSAADMSKPAEIAAMIAQATRELGSVDILVNNAGIQHVAPVEEFPLEKWDAVIAINLSAAFPRHPRRLAEHEGAQLGAHHQHRLDPRPGGVRAEGGLRRGEARHSRPDEGGRARNRHHRVTCNAICPGWVLTPLVQKQIDDRAAREKIDSRLPQR